MERTKVYPFTVCLPRYASWRKYAQALLKQLKACPACRGAADGFPVSILPKTHKLPNGKLLIFKGLTSATDQGTLCTNNEVVEEYDMVSIDPNCPRHGKYSRTAWLRKQSTKSAGVKVRSRQQIVSKAREAKNHSRQNAIDRRAHKTDEVGRISSSNLCKPLEVVAKPSSMAVSVLKKRRGENVEPDGQTQIAVSTKNVAAKDLKYMSSIFVQKQLNVLSMYNKKDLVLRTHLATKSAENSIEQRVCERGPMESNNDQSSERNVITEKRVECGVPLTTLMVRKDLRAVPILDFEKDIHKCAETYASQFRRMCLLKELDTKPFDTYHEEVETAEDQNRKLLEHVAKMDTQLEYKTSLSAEEPEQENDHIASEIAGSAGVESSTSTTTGLSKEDDQLAIHEVFNLEELQQTFSLVERLNKIANTARTLQSELEDHPVREGTPTARVQLTQVQVVDKKDARDWLLDTAIEKAINKLPDDSDGRRVRHLVQAFESIK